MAGKRKCWLDCSPAITRPLIEKMRVAIRLSRIRLATKTCCSASNPGAMPIFERTNGWATKATTTARPAVTRNARLAILLNKSQAAGRPPLVNSSERTGMNASANAPPEIKANSMSGRLLAALNTSISRDKPNCRAMITCRKNARALSTAKNPVSRKVIRVTFDNLILSLSQRHIQEHHHREPKHHANGGNIGVGAGLGGWNQFFDGDVNHRAGSEGQCIRQQWLDEIYGCRAKHPGQRFDHA